VTLTQQHNGIDSQTDAKAGRTPSEFSAKIGYGETITPINQTEIEAHCKLMIETTVRLGIKTGKLVILAVDPDNNANKAYKHFALNGRNVGPRMTSYALAQVKARRNVYAAWAVFANDMPNDSRGGAKHATHIMALASDRDAYEGLTDDGELRPAKYGDTVLPASVSVQSSIQGERISHHDIYLLSEPAKPDDAKRVGEKLRQAMRADSGTGDIVRVLRIPGTPNFPNKKKVAAGRDPNPQATLTLQTGGALYSLEDIETATDAVISKQETGKPKQQACQKGSLPNLQPHIGRKTPDIDDVSNGLRNYVTTGAEDTNVDRSGKMHSIVADLYNKGFGIAEIEALLRSNPHGVAHKYINGSDRLSDEVARSFAKAQAGGTPKMPHWKPAAEFKSQRSAHRTASTRTSKSSAKAEPGNILDFDAEATAYPVDALGTLSPIARAVARSADAADDTSTQYVLTADNI